MNIQTVRTVCKELNVSEQAVRRALANGKLEGLRVGNRVLIDLDAARDILTVPNRLNADIADVQAHTGLSGTAIRRGIREGWIPCEKIGRGYAFDLEQVEAAIRQRMASK